MFELFSDIFAFRDSRWTRLDARPKVIVALTAIVCTILSTKVILPLSVFVAATACMFTLSIPTRLVIARLAAPFALVAVLVVLQAFMVGSTVVATISVFGLHLTAMREGILQGALLGSRVLGASGVVLLLGMVTPAHKVFHSLRWFRVHHGWVEVAMLIYRYTFALLDRASDIGAAQRCRLGYAGTKRSISSVGTLAGAVIVHSLDQAMCAHDAMMLRGYTGSMPFAPMPRMRGSDRVAMILAPLAIMAVFLLLEWRRFL